MVIGSKMVGFSLLEHFQAENRFPLFLKMLLRRPFSVAELRGHAGQLCGERRP